MIRSLRILYVKKISSSGGFGLPLRVIDPFQFCVKKTDSGCSFPVSIKGFRSNSSSANVKYMENLIIYKERKWSNSNTSNSNRSQSENIEKLSHFQFPQDVLSLAARYSDELSVEEVVYAFKRLVFTAKLFYGRRKLQPVTVVRRTVSEETSGQGLKNCEESSYSWDLSSRRWRNGVRNITSDRRFHLMLGNLARKFDRLCPDDLLDCIHSLSKIVSLC